MLNRHVDGFADSSLRALRLLTTNAQDRIVPILKTRRREHGQPVPPGGNKIILFRPSTQLGGYGGGVAARLPSPESAAAAAMPTDADAASVPSPLDVVRRARGMRQRRVTGPSTPAW